MCLIMELVPGDNLHARIYRGEAGGHRSYIDILQVGHGGCRGQVGRAWRLVDAKHWLCQAVCSSYQEILHVRAARVQCWAGLGVESPPGCATRFSRVPGGGGQRALTCQGQSCVWLGIL